MVSINFQNPIYLWYLLTIPLLILTHFYFLRYSKFRGMKFANFKALKRVSNKKLFTKNYILLFLRIVILTCLIFSAAGTAILYLGQTTENDFVLAIDVSASMTSQDVLPSRIEAAKETAVSLMELLEEQKVTINVGLITFSGATYIEQIIDDDFEKIKEEINDVEVRREGGTDIAGAIVTATNLLASSERGKSIIVISDGSITISTTDSDSLKNALDYAIAERVVIHTLGIGTEGGPLGYLPEFYNASSVFNEKNLLNLANSTSGNYYKVDDKESILSAYQNIVLESEEAMIDFELSYILLLIGLMLIFLEWGLASTTFRRLP